MDSLKDIVFKFLRLENLVSHLSGYVESRIALVKLEIREELAHTMAKAIVALVLAMFGFLVLLFLSIGLAEFLNQYFIGSFGGYLIVAGLYAVVFTILLIFRSSFLHSFEKQLIEIFRKKGK